MEYESDLHWLRQWELCIHSMVAKEQLNKYSWMNFRPDELASDAMIRLSVGYAHIIKQVDDHLTWTECKFADFLESKTDSTHSNFEEALLELSTRIKIAAATIADAQENPPGDKAHPPPNTKHFIFAPDGTGYYIKGFGEHGNVTKLKGFWQIHLLIQTPGEPVSVLDLIEANKDERIVADKRSHQPVFTTEAKEKIKIERRRLKSELDQAKEKNDFAEQTRLQLEIEQIEDQSKKAYGVFGKDRDLNDLTKKMLRRVYGTLSTAYDHLREANPPMVELAVHFESSISAEGSDFIYHSAIEPTPEWSSQMSDSI